MSNLEDKLNCERVWAPIPQSSQECALDTRCHHTLFCGSRGPGKTDTQLMLFRKYVGVGYGSFWRGVIFDRAYKNLDDIVAKSKRWMNAFDDGAQFLAGTSSYKWVWKTGEELLFRVMKDADDYWDYHGQEFPFIGWNELCKWPTGECYSLMNSCNRSSFTPEKDAPVNEDGVKEAIPPIPLRVFSTTNSYGPGHMWVKHRFIDPAPYGHVVKTEVDVYNPVKKEREKIVKTQVAIFGSYKENIYLSPSYIAELELETDPNRRRSWLLGEWDITSGGALDDLWSRNVHVVPRFVVPEGWRIDRCFDWGSTHPYAVTWWAEANGEEAVLLNGKTFCPTPGSLIQLGELYGTEKLTTNRGLKHGPRKIAELIKQYEIKLMEQGWILTQPYGGPADNQIRNVQDSETETIEKRFQDEGIFWKESDKSKGSRAIGLELIRGMLEASLRKEGPGLYVMQNCTATIMLVPPLPRDEDNPDDVDTTAEDHIYDTWRYRVLKNRQRLATKIPVKMGH